MKIFAGRKPITNLGKHQFTALIFLLKYPGYHSVADDYQTRQIFKRLLELRLVIKNKYGQYKFKDRRNQT
jgi:hypothetical protein